MKGYFGVQRAAMPAGAAQPLTERERIALLEDPWQDEPGTPQERRTLQLQTLKATLNSSVADQMDSMPEAVLLPEREQEALNPTVEAAPAEEEKPKRTLFKKSDDDKAAQGSEPKKSPKKAEAKPKKKRFQFFRDVKTEMKRVTDPHRRAALERRRCCGPAVFRRVRRRA